jgi:hypothetical protein
MVGIDIVPRLAVVGAEGPSGRFEDGFHIRLRNGFFRERPGAPTGKDEVVDGAFRVRLFDCFAIHIDIVVFNFLPLREQ